MRRPRGFCVGDITIAINGNAAGLLAAVGQSEQALGRVEGSAARSGNAVTAAFSVTAVAGIAALGMGLTSAVSSAAGFEKLLSAAAWAKEPRPARVMFLQPEEQLTDAMTRLKRVVARLRP